MNYRTSLTVCTQNVKNHFKISFPCSYKLVNQGLTDMLDIYYVDLCGIQETTKNRNHNLEKHLKKMEEHGFLNKHLVTGKGRYHGLIPFFDEYNSLIVDKDKFRVISSKTYYLPWNHDLKRQMDLKDFAWVPRIATVVNLEIKNFGNIQVIVTHLDYKSLKVQNLQLDSLTKIMTSISELFILMGSFNMTPSKFVFSIYKQIWEDEFGLIEAKLTGNDLKTWMGSGKKQPKEDAPLDYIFATKEFDLIRAETVDYCEEIETDHRGVVAQFILEKRK